MGKLLIALSWITVVRIGRKRGVNLPKRERFCGRKERGTLISCFPADFWGANFLKRA